MTATELPTLTAVRTWHTTRSGRTSASIEVSQHLSPTRRYTWKVGGNRAARASSVIVTKWGEEIRVEARADAAAAYAEANRNATRTVLRSRYGDVPVTPAEWSYAVTVVDA